MARLPRFLANLPVTNLADEQPGAFPHGASAQGAASRACPASAKAFKSRPFSTRIACGCIRPTAAHFIICNIRQPAQPGQDAPHIRTAHQARAEYCSASSRNFAKGMLAAVLLRHGQAQLRFRRVTNFPAGKKPERVPTINPMSAGSFLTLMKRIRSSLLAVSDSRTLFLNQGPARRWCRRPASIAASANKIIFASLSPSTDPTLRPLSFPEICVLKKGELRFAFFCFSCRAWPSRIFFSVANGNSREAIVVSSI